MDANDPSLTQLMSRIERASLAYDAANNVVARKERAVLEKRRVLNLCLRDRLVLRKSMTEAVENLKRLQPERGEGTKAYIGRVRTLFLRAEQERSSTGSGSKATWCSTRSG